MQSDCPNLAELANASSSVIRDHVIDCASCRIVVELVAERQRNVEAGERRAECARFEMLLAARDEGTIGGTAGALLDEHLRSCASCQAVAATMPPPAERREHSSLPPVSTTAYALGREVARGGMGRILAAEDLRIGRPVAVKELLGKAPALAARFEREARVTARLQHPGIVPIYEIGKWPDGTPFYAMRMVKGRTLREALRDRKTLDERLALLPAVIAAAEAVGFAHGERIIHRDLTPMNILVGEYGDTVVIDWGLAKDLSEAESEGGDALAGPYRDNVSADGNLTAIGAVIGTAAYMPPEQANGVAVDERADVYALGAILYHVLAGEPPYHSNSSAELVRQVQEGPPRKIESVAPGAARDLVSIVEKAMSRDLARRYATARDLVEELRRFHTGRLVEAHDYSPGELVRRWVNRRRAVIVVSSLALVMLVAGGALALANILHERDRAETGEQAAVAARGLAETQRQEAHSLNVTLLAEQGRQELLAGHWSRALPFLSEAYRAGDHSSETRFMIAAAMAPLDSRQLVLHGEPSPIKKLVFAGQQLAVVHDESIEVWDISRGVRRTTLRTTHTHLADVAFSSDGQQLVAWTAGSPVLWLFELSTGRLTFLNGHEKQILLASFVGPWLISVSLDGTWRRWDVTRATSEVFATGPLLRGGGGPAGFGAPAIDEASKRLLALRTDGTAEVWDVGKGTRLQRFHLVNAYGAGLSGDGRTVIMCNADRVQTWRVDGGVSLGQAPGPGYHMMGCGFRPDGKEVFAVGDRGELDVWTIDLARRIAVLATPSGIVDPTWLRSGRMLVAARSGSLQLWDADLAALVLAVDTTDSTVFSASDNGTLVSIARDDGAVEIFDLSRLQLRKRMFDVDAVSATSTPDGSRVATQDRTGRITLHDSDNETTVSIQLALHAPVAITTTRMVAMASDQEVAVVDPQNGRLLRRQTLGETPREVEITLDGRRFTVLGSDARVLDADAGTELLRVSGTFTAAVLSDDGRRLFTVNDNHELAVWDVAKARTVTTIHLSGEVMWNGLITVAPSGEEVALPIIEGGTYALHLYDASTGRELAKVPEALLAQFSANTMLVGTMAGMVHVFRATDGAQLASFPTETGMSLPRQTPDGTRFVTSRADGVSEVRSMVDGRPLARFAMRSAIPHLDMERREFQYGLTIGEITNDSFVVGSEGTGLACWDIHLETRSPDAIARVVEERVPWRLEHGRLVARKAGAR